MTCRTDFGEDLVSGGKFFSSTDMAEQNSNRTSRQQDVTNTLASLRLENLQPSEYLKQGLQDYVDGRKTTADLLAEVNAHYAAQGQR